MGHPSLHLDDPNSLHSFFTAVVGGFFAATSHLQVKFKIVDFSGKVGSGNLGMDFG